jgi:hypothetical protein
MTKTHQNQPGQGIGDPVVDAALLRNRQAAAFEHVALDRTKTHYVPAEALRNDYGEPGCTTSVRTALRLYVGSLASPAFGLGYVDATGTARRTHGGPVLPGPYAYTYGKAVVIDNYGGSAMDVIAARDRGMLIIVNDGDTLVMPDGQAFTVGTTRGGDEIILRPVGGAA